MTVISGSDRMLFRAQRVQKANDSPCQKTNSGIVSTRLGNLWLKFELFQRPLAKIKGGV